MWPTRRGETLSTTPPAGRTGAVRRVAATVVAVVACVLGACGGTEEDAQSSRHLDPRSDAVVAIDLDYDSDNWQQVKRLYARAVQEGAWTPGSSRRRRSTARSARWRRRPACSSPTTSGRCSGARCRSASAPSRRRRCRRARATCSSASTRAPPAMRRTARATTTTTASRWTPAVEAAEVEQAPRPPATTITAVYRVETPGTGTVLDKLREQGAREQAARGHRGRAVAGEGMAVLGGDTMVSVLTDDPDRSDALLRERLQATGEGPELPDLGDDFVAVRATPAALGAWLDQEELQRALASTAGRALRGAELRLRLEADAAARDGARGFRRAGRRGAAAAGTRAAALPSDEGVASASANQEPEPPSSWRAWLASCTRSRASSAASTAWEARRRPALRGRGPARVLRALVHRAATRPPTVRSGVRGPLQPAQPGRNARAAGPASRRTSRGFSKACRGSARPG